MQVDGAVRLLASVPHIRMVLGSSERLRQGIGLVVGELTTDRRRAGQDPVPVALVIEQRPPPVEQHSREAVGVHPPGSLAVQPDTWQCSARNSGAQRNRGCRLVNVLPAPLRRARRRAKRRFSGERA